MKEAAERIARATAATGITTEQAVEAAEMLSGIMRRLVYAPGELEHEIARIRANPSLHWWQKMNIIRGLKKQIKERESNHDKQRIIQQ